MWGIAVAVLSALLLPGRSKFVWGYLAAGLLAVNEWALRPVMGRGGARAWFGGGSDVRRLAWALSGRDLCTGLFRRAGVDLAGRLSLGVRQGMKFLAKIGGRVAALGPLRSCLHAEASAPQRRRRATVTELWATSRAGRLPAAIHPGEAHAYQFCVCANHSRWPGGAGKCRARDESPACPRASGR